MIRIDELYCNTFWPWMQQHMPGIRMFYCDPPGHTAIHNLFNYGYDEDEKGYVFFHDQEPIHLESFKNLFEEVLTRNDDLYGNLYDSESTHQVTVKFHWQLDIKKLNKGSVILSEKGEYANLLEKTYNWKSYYYFYHGWAALDWYRGYDRTFLMPHWSQRTVSKTFIAPNRIVAGERQHRLEMLYYIFKNRMTHNHVSCPAVCPGENISIIDAVKKLNSDYPDIVDVFESQNLPINFKNEQGHPMHSCWLSLFNESAESLLYLVTETVAKGNRYHLTEKTFKPIALGMPFIIVGTQGSLEYLRSYGFRTFGHIWDESYDDAADNVRIKRIANLLHDLDRLSTATKQKMFYAAQSVIAHNWNHFYNGGFEQVLWQELTRMLNDIKSNS
jgi:hypothetical protein